MEYEPLEGIFDPLEAVEGGACLLHPDMCECERVPWFFPEADTNIAHCRKTRKGDIERGFAEADEILEDTYTVPRYAHCAIEPHVIVGLQDHSGRLTLWSSSVWPSELPRFFRYFTVVP